MPEDLVGQRETYVLRVKGDSMIDEQIRDGDFVVVEDRKTADNGEMVIALLGGSDVTLKKFYRENGRVRLQPANPTMQPLIVDVRRRCRSRASSLASCEDTESAHVHEADQFHASCPDDPARSPPRPAATTPISAPSRTRRST